jgi:hypothetical protein
MKALFQAEKEVLVGKVEGLQLEIEVFIEEIETLKIEKAIKTECTKNEGIRFLCMLIMRVYSEITMMCLYLRRSYNTCYEQINEN